MNFSTWQIQVVNWGVDAVYQWPSHAAHDLLFVVSRWDGEKPEREKGVFEKPGTGNSGKSGLNFGLQNKCAYLCLSDWYLPPAKSMETDKCLW